MTTGEAIALGAIQTSVLVTAAPLLNGCIKKIKARFQMRRGPPLLQDYWNIWKWLARSEQRAESASFVSSIAPWGILAAVGTASLFVPVFSEHAPLRSAGDLFVFIAFLALGRALLTMGGMDSGSAFGQMGSSRELAISAMVEPVLLLSLVALSIEVGSTRFPDIVAFGDQNSGQFVTLGWALAIVSFVVVVVAETGRIPVDNPDTHLELTMVHEGMLIEFSGRSLGVLHISHLLKQTVLLVLFVNVFFPFGITGASGVIEHALVVALVTGKVLIAAGGLAVIESVFAKMRLFELPDLIGAAGFAAMLGAALVVIF
jgi:formate hydrogenlyase subunit 4